MSITLIIHPATLVLTLVCSEPPGNPCIRLCNSCGSVMTSSVADSEKGQPNSVSDSKFCCLIISFEEFLAPAFFRVYEFSRYCRFFSFLAALSSLCLPGSLPSLMRSSFTLRKPYGREATVFTDVLPSMKSSLPGKSSLKKCCRHRNAIFHHTNERKSSDREVPALGRFDSF